MKVMFPLNMTYLLQIKKHNIGGSSLKKGYNGRKIGFVWKDRWITLHFDSKRTLKCQGPLCRLLLFFMTCYCNETAPTQGPFRPEVHDICTPKTINVWFTRSMILPKGKRNRIKKKKKHMTTCNLRLGPSNTQPP